MRLQDVACTAWKVAVFEVILVPVFPNLIWIRRGTPMRTKIMRTKITPNTETLFMQWCLPILNSLWCFQRQHFLFPGVDFYYEVGFWCSIITEKCNKWTSLRMQFLWSKVCCMTPSLEDVVSMVQLLKQRLLLMLVDTIGHMNKVLCSIAYLFTALNAF